MRTAAMPSPTGCTTSNGGSIRCGFYARAHVLRDPAFNVAHWNLPERSIAIRDGAVLVDGRPCRLFRFSGYDPDAPQAPTRYSPRLTWENLGPARELFERVRARPRRGRLLANQALARRLQPLRQRGGDSGFRAPPLPSGGQRRRSVRRSAANRTALAGGSRSNQRVLSRDVRLRREWSQLLRVAQRTGRRTGRRHHAAVARRLSGTNGLQNAFPDVFGADCSRFVEWTASSGMREHGFPDALMNPGHL